MSTVKELGQASSALGWISCTLLFREVSGWPTPSMYTLCEGLLQFCSIVTKNFVLATGDANCSVSQDFLLSPSGFYQEGATLKNKNRLHRKEYKLIVFTIFINLSDKSHQTHSDIFSNKFFIGCQVVKLEHSYLQESIQALSTSRQYLVTFFSRFIDGQQCLHAMKESKIRDLTQKKIQLSCLWEARNFFSLWKYIYIF